MFSTLMFTILAAVGGSARAAGDNELSLSVGRIGAPDDNWQMFSDEDGLSSVGVRAGYGFSPSLAVVLDWQHGVEGGGLETYAGYDEDYDYSYGNLAITTNAWSVGPKLSLDAISWLKPYATVQGTFLWGTVKLDDDPGDDENLNELRRSGVTGGASAALGLDLVLLSEQRTIRPAIGFEAGYGWLAPLGLGDMGQLRFRGFHSDFTVGARF